MAQILNSLPRCTNAAPLTGQKRTQFQLVTNFLNPMEYDKEKVDDMTLALLWLTMFDQGSGTRAWKEFNWEHMNRLHENGYIDDPKSKARSVTVTKTGKTKAEELFKKHFGL